MALASSLVVASGFSIMTSIPRGAHISTTRRWSKVDVNADTACYFVFARSASRVG